MKAEEILNLFELIKNAPEENWVYNKSRLREILCDYEKNISNVLVLEGNFINASILTDKVIETLESIKNTNSLDEILFYPRVREQFRKRLYSQLKEI